MDVPRIWEETVDAHRDAVLDAIAHATARVVHRAGVGGLTMSAIAAEAGIGRATLYRYVKDAGAALALWQEHGVALHLRQLEDFAATADPDRRLAVVLERYALNRQHRHGPGHAELSHSEILLDSARAKVRELFSELLRVERDRGRLRTDMTSCELAAYAVAALEACSDMPSADAARQLARLVHDSLTKGHAPGEGSIAPGYGQLGE
mgnify:CR=1 FL=1|jgi:AcrR family transcriptional regulator